MSIRILAIDTTTEACSAALMLEKDLLLEKFIISPKKHMQHILPIIDNLLSEANITLKKLDALAFSRGPGSFAGIRIGMCIAQGLALGADIPLISISTLATLAEGARRKTGICQVLTAIDARMKEIYWAQYKLQSVGSWIAKDHEVVISPKKAISSLNINLTEEYWATAGSGWKTYPILLNIDKLNIISGETILPNAKDMIPLALYFFQHGKTQSVEMVEPTYLRNNIICKKNKN